MELELDVPGSVREVPERDGPGRVGRLGQPGDIERLARGEVDAAQHDDRELGAMVDDRRLQVGWAHRRFTRSGPDHGQIGRGVEPARG